MYRVIQWTTGNVGRRAVRAIVEHPELELVGLFAHGEDKLGRDAGELCGLPPLGVRATNDVDALLALRADCVNYNGLFPDVDVIERFLAAGTNVVITSGMLTGKNLGIAPRLERAAQAGRASLFGSGINPGFMNMLPVVLTALTDRVHSISMTETADVRNYPSAGSWETFGWGKPLGHQMQDMDANPMNAVFLDGLDWMADALGIELSDHKVETDYAIATRDIELPWMRFPKGTVAGQRISWKGFAKGRCVVRCTVAWKMGEDLEPNWSAPQGYEIVIEGEPRIRSVVELEQPTLPGLSGPSVMSRMRTMLSSMNRSRMPVLEKSRKEVSSVTLAAGCSPRAASTARAVARIVPPMQKPKVLILSLPLISCTRPIARMTASSMYWSQVARWMLSSALRQLTTNRRWPCSTV